MSQDLSLFMYQALSTPFGIVVHTDPECRDDLRQKFYQARKALADPSLSVLKFKMGLDPSELWITHGGEDNGEA